MSTLNLNIGILGHVDSGKTSFSKLLSTVASTSAFDKNPQSQKRGITLDLGFSSFTLNSNDYPFLESIKNSHKHVQFTLVDCPGHSSLIRTVLCASRIIDMVLLVIDVTKGFQTQTAECLIISEITCDQMIVILNKCDLLEPYKREESIAKPNFDSSNSVDNNNNNSDIQKFFQKLTQSIADPTSKRNQLINESFTFAVDHCFTVTGQGTVMTGTVLAGQIGVNQVIDLPYHNIQKKIKSIQMFRKPVTSIGPGDRAGICVPQLDPTLLERGLIGASTNVKTTTASAAGAAAQHHLAPCHACILGCVKKISYFKPDLLSKSKLHIFVCQETVLAKLTFIRLTHPTMTTTTAIDPDASHSFDVSASYEYMEKLDCYDNASDCENVFVLLEFERPVICPVNTSVIGAKLDNYSVNSCRLAFHGKIIFQLFGSDYRQKVLPNIQVYRCKSRRGFVDRIVNSRTCIVRGLFKSETNQEIFLGLKAKLEWITNDKKSGGDSETTVQSTTMEGYIESSFGQSGKCRFTLNDDMPQDLIDSFAKRSNKKGAVEESNYVNPIQNVVVILEFKRHVFNLSRKIFQ